MPAPSITTVDGHRVAFEARGAGDRALVFVHGWTSGRWQWRPQMEVDWGRRVLALDLQGHGDSDKPDVAYTMDFFARGVTAAMDAAAIQRAVLVGHSNGVPIVRQVSRRFPARVEGLVAVDGPLRPIRPEMLAWFKAAVERPDYEDFMRQMASQLPAGTLKPEDRRRLQDAQLVMPRHVMRGGVEALADSAIWTEDPITAPLLVMTVKSPMNPGAEELEAVLRRFVPKLTVQLWEGVSHFFPLEHPERFNRALRAWLETMP